MTNEELSNTFDTLLNSYNIQANFGEVANKQSITLDEYEKSVLLTQAQDIIVKSYFDKTLNQQSQGFDDSARRQVDFSSLIHVHRFPAIQRVESTDAAKCYDSRGIPVNLDCTPKILLMLNEKLEATTTSSAQQNRKETYVVVPINYNEYDREMSKAYAQPLKKQAWRLFSNISTGYDIQSEIIPIEGLVQRLASKEDLDYVIRYVGRPNPIILTELPNGLTIDGISVETPCNLNPILHMDILNKAFELAITTRGGGTAQRQQVQESNQRR